MSKEVEALIAALEQTIENLKKGEGSEDPTKATEDALKEILPMSKLSPKPEKEEAGEAAEGETPEEEDAEETDEPTDEEDQGDS